MSPPATGSTKLRQGKLRIVHAWLFGGTGFEGFFPALVGELDDLRRAADAALDATVREVAADRSGVEIECHVVEGMPAAVLVEESRDAELLVVGSLLIYIRYLLHFSLLEEAANMGFAETVCPNCHMHIVASGFCPNCGMALSAVPGSVRRSRRPRAEAAAKSETK